MTNNNRPFSDIVKSALLAHGGADVHSHGPTPDAVARFLENARSSSPSVGDSIALPPDAGFRAAREAEAAAARDRELASERDRRLAAVENISDVPSALLVRWAEIKGYIVTDAERAHRTEPGFEVIAEKELQRTEKLFGDYERDVAAMNPEALRDKWSVSRSKIFGGAGDWVENRAAFGLGDPTWERRGALGWEIKIGAPAVHLEKHLAEGWKLTTGLPDFVQRAEKLRMILGWAWSSGHPTKAQLKLAERYISLRLEAARKRRGLGDLEIEARISKACEAAYEKRKAEIRDLENAIAELVDQLRAVGVNETTVR